MAELLTPPRDRLVPVKRESLPAAMPAAIASPGYSASLSADQQTVTDVLSQVYRGTSVVRMAPLPPSASATSNAAANSAAQVIVENSSSGSGSTTVSGVSSVELDMPIQFAVSGSPGTGAVDLGVTWTAENPGDVLQTAPTPGLSSYEGSTTADVANGPTGNSGVTVSRTPTSSTTLAILVEVMNATLSSAGWTRVGASTTYYRAISGTSPISATFASLGANSADSTSLSLFSVPSPSLVQSEVGATISGTLSQTNTAGNTLIVTCSDIQNSPDNPVSITLSDSLGNIYTQVQNYSFAASTSTPSFYQTAVFVCTNCIGGANTLTYQYTVAGGSARNYNNTTTWMEFNPLPVGNSIPYFSPLNIDLGAANPTFGILPVTKGGTGANLSSTGGTSNFLSKSSATANITVVRPDFSDLAGGAGKFPANFNGIATVSNGLPSEIKTVDLTGQGAAITATALLAASQTGMYRISWSATITTADGVSSSLGGTNGFQVVYTSPTDSVAKTTAPQTPWATGLNTTGTADGGVMVVYAKGGTNIQYAYDYTSATPGQMKYELHIKLEAL